MEKENKRLKKTLYKKERIRLNRLVNLSQEFDPRIIEWRKKEEEIKQKKKDEIKKRKDEKRRKIEEQKQRKIDEQKRIELEKIQKEKEQKEKKLKKKKEEENIKVTFKTLFLEKIKEDKMDKFFADEIIRKLNFIELDLFIKKLNSGEIKTGKDVKIELKLISDKRKNSKKEKQNNEKKNKKISTEQLAKKWNEDEMRLLHKGVNKYPAGTHNRWKRIATFIGGRFSENEVIEIAKKLKNVSIKGKSKSNIQLFTVNEKKKVSKNISN